MEEMEAYKLIIKGIVSELPEEKRKEVDILVEKMDKIISEGEDCGKIALTLLAAKYAS